VPVLLKLNSVEYRRELYRSVYLHLIHLAYYGLEPLKPFKPLEPLEPLEPIKPPEEALEETL
jgi:hypothetical protein